MPLIICLKAARFVLESMTIHLKYIIVVASYIPEEKIDEIWLPFKKGDVSRSNTKGTGLGLAISRAILELHKLSYGARNSENGVIFWFKFR